MYLITYPNLRGIRMVIRNCKQIVGLLLTVVLAISMVTSVTTIGTGGSDERDYYFVQFTESPSQPMLNDIISLGGVPHQYYNTHRYLVEMDPGQKDLVLALPHVSGIERYEPADKYPGELMSATGNIGLRIELHKYVDAESVAERLREIGVDVFQVSSDGFKFLRCNADATLINAISRVKEVNWMQREFEPGTLMNYISTNTYMGINTPQLAGFDGTGLLAEVQDNGCDIDVIVGAGNGHPDLENVIYTDYPCSSNDHGTCTSGIMFGTGLNNALAEGILPGATGAFADWMNGNYNTINHLWNGDFNEGSSPIPGIAQTNSWWSGGLMSGQYDSYSHEIDLAAFNFPYVQTHWACGNSNNGGGTAKGTMSCESVSKNDISVGAIFHQNTADMSDDAWENHGMAATPSRGPAADGRVKPDMCGAFDWILTCDEEPGGYVGGIYYDDFGGTSGACPTVCGCTCLVYDMYKDNYFGNNAMHAWPHSCTAKAIMIADAQQYPIGPNQIDRDVEGWGAPDMENCYNLGPDYHVINEYPQTLSSGMSWSRTVSSDGSHPLKVTLCWIDPPAASSTGTGRALVNNLDLKVTTPMMVSYWGNNGLNDDIWSTSGAGPNHWSIPADSSYRDDRNNVENVFLPSPLPGVYTIEVFARAGDMNNGSQDFSICASGAIEGEPPSATVSQPNGGEVWTEGDFHDIIWTMSDNEDLPEDLSVTIDYSTNGGATYPYNIITDQTGFSSPASYNWQIPNTPTTNAKVRVTVTDLHGLPASDVSDNTFTITVNLPLVDVTYPDGGESFLGGGSESITWTASAGSNPLIPTPISIDYSATGPGGPWIPLAANEANDGDWLWDPIPTADSVNCYVRVTAEDTMGYTGSDTGDAAFEIDSTAPQPASDPYAEITGNHVMIYWTPSPSADIDHYEVWWSLNNWDPSGFSYTSHIDTAGPVSSVQHTNVGSLNANSYYYQVKAYDEVGHEAITTSRQAAKFGSTQSTLANPSGWFMLGSSLVQSDTSLAHVIQGQGLPANMDCIRTYDPVTGTWPITIPGAPGPINTVTDLDDETGFWMHVTSSTRFATAGYIIDQTITMRTGWNLVPYPFAQRFMNTAGIAAHLAANCPNYAEMLILDYTQPYHLKSPTGSENIFNNQAIWVRVTADTVWTVINY
jgi:hypothetical protein